MPDYRNSKLGIWIRNLYYWNTDGYDLGYRSQYLDDEGIQYTGMRTEQLALWIIERKEECVENIVSISNLLGVDVLAIVSNRKYLDQFIDTNYLSDKDIQVLIKQINSEKSRVPYYDGLGD